MLLIKKAQKVKLIKKVDENIWNKKPLRKLIGKFDDYQDHRISKSYDYDITIVFFLGHKLF